MGTATVSEDYIEFSYAPPAYRKCSLAIGTELTLRTTKDGIRLVNVPVKEVESLCKPLRSWKSLSSDEANRHLKEFYDADCLRIKTTIKLSHATDAGFNLFGQRMIGYDMNSNTLNGRFYSPHNQVILFY